MWTTWPGWPAPKTFTRSLLAVSLEAPPGSQWRHSHVKRPRSIPALRIPGSLVCVETSVSRNCCHKGTTLRNFFSTLLELTSVTSWTSWSFESDGHPRYHNKQQPSKWLLFGQKQIVYSVVFFVVPLFCCERTTESYLWLPVLWANCVWYAC